MNILPVVSSHTRYGYHTSDIVSSLLQDRMIFLNGPIDMDSASLIVMQLLHLEAENPDADVQLFLNTGGGEVDSGMYIIDVMDYIKSDVMTICGGICASMGSVILSSGTKGKRCAFPNSSVMAHQIKSGKGYSQAVDILIYADWIDYTNRKLLSRLAKNTGKKLEQLLIDADRDHYFTAKEAVEYGLVDYVIKN